MSAENISPSTNAAVAVKAFSRIVLRGLALGIIWTVASLVFLLAGMELARLLGALNYQRDLTLMVLRIPVPGIWISFFVMGLRFFALPSLVGGVAISFYEELSFGERAANTRLHLLFGGFIGGLMAFAGLSGLFLSVGFLSARSGWLFAVLFALANTAFGALLMKWEVAE